MSAINPEHITIFLDSGAPSGVTLLTDGNGNPTYASWIQTLSQSLLIPEPGEYEVGIASAVYRTPIAAGIEDGTSSVIVYMDILMGSSIGNTTYTVLARLPPTIANYDPVTRLPITAAPGSWPTVFQETSTVIPWVPLGMGIIRQITTTFASSRGGVIVTNGATPATPFNLVLVLRRRNR